MLPDNARLRLLHIEDSADDAELVRTALEMGGFAVETHRVETEADMAAALAQGGWDLIISDYNLPRFSAPRALEVLADRRQTIPFVIASGMVGEEEAVALIKAGATDFVMKSNLIRLPAVVERALRECATRQAHRLATAALHESEARYRTITANLPGMVYQAFIFPDDRMEFLYVSDQCKPLLGIEADALKANPELLLGLTAAEDTASYRALHAEIRHGLSKVNWEGRFRIPPEHDIKWINIRASNRRLPSGEVLSEGIMSNITQNKSWQMDLVRSQEQLRELSSHLQLAKEQERGRIARELHDELGSTLTAIKIDLLRLTSGLPGERVDLFQKVGSATNLLDQAMDTVRNVSQSLRPGILDYGLQAAIEWQTREFEKRLGIACELNCHAEVLSLDADASTAMFRVFQETLTNISKHADASRVSVTLAEDEEMVFLEVEDDGNGIAAKDMLKEGSFGIRNMRERVEALGGDFEIDAGSGGGTRVCVTIPLSSEDAVDEMADTQQRLFKDTINS
jgi:signal transduction histidine kinase